MAAQLKEHNSDQLRGICAYQQTRKCTHCGQKSFRVIESRRHAGARRRRYHCDTCGHRETFYEINQKDFEELVYLRKSFETMSKIFIGTTEDRVPEKFAQNKTKLSCDSCGFFETSTDTCSLDVPEFGTKDVYDCPSFIQDK